MKINQQDIKRIAEFGKSMCKDESNGPERIAGLFYKGYITTIASPAGTGKTWFMQVLACNLSTGTKFLPGMIDNTQQPKPQKVIILEGEAEDTVLNQRLAETNWCWDQDMLKIYNALDFAINDIPYFINTPDGQRTILTIMEAEHPDIVFIDSLVAWNTADESKEAEMVNVFNFLIKLNKFYKCALVLNHHTRKMPAQQVKRQLQTDDVIGTGLFARYSRDVYILSPKPDDIVQVYHAKSWDKKHPLFSYQFVDDGCFIDLAFKVDVEVQSHQDNTAEARILDYIQDLHDYDLIEVKVVAKIINASIRTTKRILDKLVFNGTLCEMSLFGKKTPFYKKPETINPVIIKHAETIR